MKTASHGENISELDSLNILRTFKKIWNVDYLEWIKYQTTSTSNNLKQFEIVYIFELVLFVPLFDCMQRKQ